MRIALPDTIGLGDILDLLPTDIRDKLSQHRLEFDELVTMIVRDAPTLNLALISPTADCFVSSLLGHIHVAGVPCTDFSLMGKRQQTHGLTMQCFLVWIRLVVIVQPLFILFENVRFFPVDVLRDLLGHLYFVDDALVDPSKLGWPARRIRRYVSLRARRIGKAGCLMSDFFGMLESDRRLPGRVLFAESGEHGDVLQTGYAKRLSGYVARYGPSDSQLFDLSQNPNGRPRASKENAPCMTLTTGSSHIYCPGEARCLTGNELLLAQGHPECMLGDEPLTTTGVALTSSSNPTKVRLAGNAMCAAAVGPLLWWIARQCIRLDNYSGYPTVVITRVIEDVSHDLHRRHAPLPNRLAVSGLTQEDPQDDISVLPTDRELEHIERDAHEGPVPISRGIGEVACDELGLLERHEHLFPGPGSHSSGHESVACLPSLDLPKQIGDFAHCLMSILRTDHVSARRFLKSTDAGDEGSQRVRNIYPIPGIPRISIGTEFTVEERWSDNAIGILCDLANASLKGLSFLAGFELQDCRVSTVCYQRSIQQRAVSTVATLVNDDDFLVLAAVLCFVLMHATCWKNLRGLTPLSISIQSMRLSCGILHFFFPILLPVRCLPAG